MIVDGVLFDSKQEAWAYRILHATKLIDTAEEGVNVHVHFRLFRRSIEVDFVLKDGTCIDVHHFGPDEDMAEYWRERKKFILNRQYFVFPDVDEMRLEMFVE